MKTEFIKLSRAVRDEAPEAAKMKSEAKIGGNVKKSAAALLIAALCASAFACSASTMDSANSVPGDFGSSYKDALSSGGAPEEASAPEIGYTSQEAPAAGGFGSLPVTARPAEAFAEKIIYSANANIESVEFDTSLEALSEMISSYGAFIENSNVSGADYASEFYGRNPYRSASYTIRVPRENFDAMLEALSRLGNITYRSTYAENVTEQYTDADSRLKARRIEEERLLAMLEKADTVEDMITIESKLSEVRYDIESLTSRLTNLDNRVNYSAVYVNINEVERLTRQEPIHLSYGQRIAEGLKQTLRGVGNFFTEALRLFIVNLPVLVLLAVAVIIAVAINRRVVKRRRKRESAASGDKLNDKPGDQ
ncbi:MAG: DUF4349 domain-containing protein [Oscillospiraceae bacterium]|jgi:hypothetical protein|nr:DUF4349 domain-containing protein [Oscillospiraceae bacterium]